MPELVQVEPLADGPVLARRHPPQPRPFAAPAVQAGALRQLLQLVPVTLPAGQAALLVVRRRGKDQVRFLRLPLAMALQEMHQLIRDRDGALLGVLRLELQRLLRGYRKRTPPRVEIIVPERTQPPDRESHSAETSETVCTHPPSRRRRAW